ncbi:MAG: nitrogenase iron-molybdenum cofactor biosynthesis protein NifE [Chitinispirillaceae bacterium]
METNVTAILGDRINQITEAGAPKVLECEKPSAAGSVSQRACVFCGSRVVLYPITDALHLVHGPAGCAAYTWDIRGALSSGEQLHRMSFSTDLKEREVIYGGEDKLKSALDELIDRFSPAAAFVYSTCISGIIGDDVGAVCKKVSASKAIPVIPVESEGFKGTKKDGYSAACGALFRLIRKPESKIPLSINIIGDFNIAGETWIIENYYKRMGIKVQSVMTGDGKIEKIVHSASAMLNVVQCSGSMIHLAQMMKDRYGIPFMRVSYFGIEDTADALYKVADHFKNEEVNRRTRELVEEEVSRIMPQLKLWRRSLQDCRAALYVGGAFKAISLVKALRHLGMNVVMAGTQTGNKEDYNVLRNVCDEDTVILDDSNPSEMAGYLVGKNVDLFIGGVKERPIAFKLGIGFCDHNHERKIPLAGFEGMKAFGREVFTTVKSPVWKFHPRKGKYTNKPDQER